MAALVAVIDLGKTNSKLALVDTTNAQEVSVVTQPNVVKTDDRYPCIDCQAIESFIIEALHESCQQFRVDALTVTTHGATGALINPSGELALPVLDYEFEGVEEQGADYEAIRPAFSETGSPRLPAGLNLGAQLYWQQMQFPTEFSNASAFLTWPQYWVYQLCGALHNDVSSLGAHTDLYDPGKQRYSSLVQRAHWTSLMPDTRKSGELCGTLNSAWLKRIGLASELPVYTGIHDSNASLVPHLMAQHAPFSVVSTGTWIISMSVGGASMVLDEHRDTLYNVNAFGDPVPSARFMGGRERELLMQTDGEPLQINRASAIGQLIKNDAAVQGMLMPSMLSGIGPYPDCTAHWINEPQDISRRDCLVALYLALLTAQCLSLVGARGITFVEGPLADDDLYCQMLSVATQGAVSISNSQTGTSTGAAMLIQTPIDRQGYSRIKVDPELRVFLEQYANVWREQLNHHAR